MTMETPSYVTTSSCPAFDVGRFDPEKHRDRKSVRVSGNLKRAHIETSSPAFPSRDVPWVPELVPGSVTVDGNGHVMIESDALDASAKDTLAADFERALRDAGLVMPAEKGKRYQTESYVALDRAEAERLAKVDGGSIREADAELLHANGEWAFWSDGKFTTSIGLPRWATQIRSLSRAAESLISECRGSDSGPPKEIGGYKALADVASFTTTTVSEGPPKGVWARAKIDRLDLVMRDGSTRTIYRFTEGYFEGYACDLGETAESVTPRPLTYAEED
jgi:hypothetical protein